MRIRRRRPRQFVRTQSARVGVRNHVQRSVVAFTVVGAMLAIAGCESDGPRTLRGANQPANSADSRVATSTTTPQTTTSAPTTTTGAPATTITTTTLPDPCAAFDALPSLERMNAVNAGTAPGDAGCAPQVEAATAAVPVYAAAQTLNDADMTTVLTDLVCQPGFISARLTNQWSFPVVVWGVGLGTDANNTTVWFRPFLTPSIDVGASYDLRIDRAGGDAHAGCNISAAVAVAPVGEYAADGAVTPIAADDPQASTDINVWFPALASREQELERDAFVGNWRSFALTNVEDLHSTDYFEYPDGDGSTAPEVGTGPSVQLTLCGELMPVDTSGLDGEFRFGVAHLTREDGYTALTVGLFRRGSDGRWRYLGPAQVVQQTPTAVCALPPN